MPNKLPSQIKKGGMNATFRRSEQSMKHPPASQKSKPNNQEPLLNLLPKIFFSQPFEIKKRFINFEIQSTFKY